MVSPISAWDALLRPIILNCAILKYDTLYWINEILLMGYSKLKIFLNVRIHSDGRKGNLRTLFPEPRWLLTIHWK